MDLGTDQITELIDAFKSRIREHNASSTIDFDVAVWSSDKDKHDAVYVIRDLFSHVIKEMKSLHPVTVRYVGAPKYQFSLTDININTVDSVYEKIQTIMIDYLKSRGVSGFDIRIDNGSKVIDHGNISITFPSEINTL